MSVTTLRRTAAIASFALCLAIGWNVHDGLAGLAGDAAECEALESAVRARVEVRATPVSTSDTRIDYASVKSGWIAFDWTGAPPAEPFETSCSAGPPPPPPPPPPPRVAELLRVLWIQEDLAEPERSAIYVEYLPKSGVAETGIGERFLRTGDRLRSPQETIQLTHVSAQQGATFAFDDEEREPEVVAVEAFDVGGVLPLTSGARVRVGPSSGLGPFAGASAPPRSDETRQVGPNRYRTGSRDIEYLKENYPEEILRLKTRRHRDPVTGRYVGIQIHSVPKGSVAERHGLEPGDVLKAVNGEAVTSTSEALTFARTRPDLTRFEILVENRGRERTIVIDR